jgi:hypothetical protein
MILNMILTVSKHTGETVRLETPTRSLNWSIVSRDDGINSGERGGRTILPRQHFRSIQKAFPSTPIEPALECEILDVF